MIAAFLMILSATYGPPTLSHSCFCLLHLLTSCGTYSPVTSLGLSSGGDLWPEDQ